MKSETVSGLGIALALALIAGALLAVWLIGSERLFILAVILIGGLVVAGIIAASAFAIRAYRKTDNPPVIEKHVYHEGRQIIRERVIDGRQALAPEVKLLQLPAQAQGGAFPELLRAAYQAGTLRGAPQEAPIDAELRELGPADWGGDLEA
jgi:hypothetical protein